VEEEMHKTPAAGAAPHGTVALTTLLWNFLKYIAAK
jgi:hypothetical protein